jgi:hypothetical protein
MALTDKYLTEHEIYDDIIITDAILKEEPLTKEQAHTIYPYLKKSYRPTTDTSFVAQVKRAFKYDRIRHITGDIYRLTLSKLDTIVDKPELDQQLKPLGLQSKQIHYIEQTNSNLVVNLTIPSKIVDKILQEI